MSIHKVSSRLKNVKKRIKNNPKISNRNKDLILEYEDQLFAEGLSKSRVLFYLNRLYKTAEYIDCDFVKADKSDIKRLVTRIEKRTIIHPKRKKITKFR